MAASVDDEERRRLAAALRTEPVADEVWKAALAALDEGTRWRLALELGRRLLPRVPDPRASVALQVAGLFAEGKATNAQLARATGMAEAVAMSLENAWAQAQAGGRPAPRALVAKRAAAVALHRAARGSLEAALGWLDPGDRAWCGERLAQHLLGGA